MQEKVARTQLRVSDFVFKTANLVFKTANLVFTTTNLVGLARFFGAPPTDFNVQTDDAEKKGLGTRGQGPMASTKLIQSPSSRVMPVSNFVFLVSPFVNFVVKSF